MKKNRLKKIGFIGTVVTALCCFTPLLVWIFAIGGLSAITVYADYVLLPLLFIFILITIYAFVVKKY